MTKVRLPVKELTQALNIVAPAAQTKTFVPITENAWIFTSGNMVIVKTTDMNITIQHTFRTTEDNIDLTFLINHRSLLAYLKLVNSVYVEMTINDDLSVAVKSGKEKATIEGEDPKDFPLTPDEDVTASLTTTTDLIHEIKRKIAPFTSTDDLRPAMTGVNIVLTEKDKLKINSTDTHVFTSLDFDVNGEGELNVITQNKFALIAGIFTDEEPIELTFTEKTFKITGMHSEYDGRLIEEKYVDVKSAMELYSKGDTLMVDRLALIAEIKKAVIFGNDEQFIELEISSGKMSLRSSNPQRNTNYQNEIWIDYQGPELTIGMSGKYMLNMLSPIDEEEVNIMHFESPMKPLRIEDKTGFVGMISPMGTI